MLRKNKTQTLCLGKNGIRTKVVGRNCPKPEGNSAGTEVSDNRKRC